VKTGWNLAKSSLEGYGSKRAVFPMMTMMMMMNGYSRLMTSVLKIT
jgi:hypothetical protein